MNCNLKKKIIIVSSRQRYGGSIVLHLLCKLLIDEGVDARIFLTDVFKRPNESIISFWIRWLYWKIKDYIKIMVGFFCKEKYDYIFNVPIKKIKRKYIPIINKRNTIVIYPESFYGDIFNAKYVVRYILYYYKFKNNKDAYGENDLFVCYRKKFNDYDLNPKEYELCVHQFNTEIYKQTNFNSHREGNCYIIRKGKSRDDLPKIFDGPIIDDLSEEEKVEIFNKCKYCYSYDTQTFYTKIAALCGCIPIVMVEQGKNVNDYLTSEDYRLRCRIWKYGGRNKVCR